MQFLLAMNDLKPGLNSSSNLRGTTVADYHFLPPRTMGQEDVCQDIIIPQESDSCSEFFLHSNATIKNQKELELRFRYCCERVELK
jgi:hypothetical protein